MDVTITIALLISIVMGLTQVAKKAGVNHKFLPLIAVILGLGIALTIYYVTDEKLINSIVSGLLIGLSAVGLYSSQKNIREGLRGEY